jgi:hypothetical protein
MENWRDIKDTEKRRKAKEGLLTHGAVVAALATGRKELLNILTAQLDRGEAMTFEQQRGLVGLVGEMLEERRMSDEALHLLRGIMQDIKGNTAGLQHMHDQAALGLENFDTLVGLCGKG